MTPQPSSTGWTASLRRPRVSMLATVAVLCAGAGVVGGAQAAPARCHVSPGPWTTTSTPPGTNLINTTEQNDSQGELQPSPVPGVGLAVDPASPKDMFYATPRQLFRTLDGGCTWQLAFSLDSQPGTSSSPTEVVASSDQLYSITSLAIASTSRTANHATVYVTATETQANQETLDELPTLFLVSTDGGATFHAPQPLPSANAPEAPEGVPACENTTLEVAPSDPKTVYMQCEQTRLWWLSLGFYTAIAFALFPNASPLFVTHDAGQSWTQVSAALGVLATQPVQSGDGFLLAGNQPPSQPDFIVDPRHPNTLWTTNLAVGASTTGAASGQLGQYATGVLWRSTDSGATWTKVFAPADTHLAGVDAEYTPSGVERIVTWGPSVKGNSKPQVYLSLNGRSWAALPAIPLTAIPKVNGALQSWTAFEAVTFAAATNDILAILQAGGDYGNPGAPCTHAEAVHYTVKSKRWSPVPTPKEAIADPHGISLAWPASDHRGLATTTYYANGGNGSCGSNNQPVLLSYTDHTRS